MLFFFFFFPCLPAEDICVFTISCRKLEAWCSLRARVRQSERHSKFACETVCVLHVEQTGEGTNRLLVYEFRSLNSSPQWLSGFCFVILQYFGTFWLFGCRSSKVSIDCVRGFSCSFLFSFFKLPSCSISCFYVLFWLHLCVRMSFLRWHRLSVFWKNWMFNQESGEEPGFISQTLQHETEGNAIKENSNLKTQNLDSTHLNSEVTKQTVEVSNLKVVGVTHNPGLLMRSLSEPCSHSEVQTISCPQGPEARGRTVPRSCCSELGIDAVLQVDNGSEGDDSFLQREGSQRRSRRRFRRINPRGERELITDSQEPSGYTTVRGTPW